MAYSFYQKCPVAALYAGAVNRGKVYVQQGILPCRRGNNAVVQDSVASLRLIFAGRRSVDPAASVEVLRSAPCAAGTARLHYGIPNLIPKLHCVAAPRRTVAMLICSIADTDRFAIKY
jgi:hypothetical protein